MKYERTPSDPERLGAAIDTAVKHTSLLDLAEHWPGARSTDRARRADVVPVDAVLLVLTAKVERFGALLRTERAHNRDMRAAIDLLTGGARAVLDIAAQQPQPTPFDGAATRAPSTDRPSEVA